MRDADRGERGAENQIRQQKLFDLLVVAAGDPLISSGPLRNDEGCRQAGRSQAEIALRDLDIGTFGPAPVPLRALTRGSGGLQWPCEAGANSFGWRARG